MWAKVCLELEEVLVKVFISKLGQQLGDDGFQRLNIDKNNQSQSGDDMIVIGNFANGTDENVYTLKTLSNSTPFRATASKDGTLWLIIGTESGFEGKTTTYYNTIEVLMK